MPGFNKRATTRQAIFSGATANAAAGVSVNVTDYRNVVIALATSGSATATVKVKGAVLPPSEAVPDFSAAASPSNHWTYVNSFDLESNGAVAGSTGYAAAGTDIVKLVKVNVDGLDRITLEISGRTAGAVTAWVVGYDNF